jgi:hypothetical protein
LLDDFYFQNGGNIQDGVFQIFYDFLQALELLNLLFQNMKTNHGNKLLIKKQDGELIQDGVWY